MALKLRGSSQVKENSITLSKIKDLQSGKILGRAVDADYTGKPLDPNNPESIVELGAEDIRRISGLWELDDVKFNDLTLSKLTSDQSGGDLIVEGEVNIGENLTINNDKFKITSLSGNLETKGTMTSEGDIKLVDSNDVEQHALLATDGSLTSAGLIKSKSSFEVCPLEYGSETIKFSVNNQGNVIVAGIGDFGNTVTVGNLITLHGDSTDATNNGKIEAKLLSLDTGVSGETMTFDSTGLNIGKNLTVGGNLTVNGTLTTDDTANLVVEDSLIFLAKNNNAFDSLDIGFVGKYYQNTTQPVIENGTFDSDLSGWTDISSIDVGSSTWSAQYSSSYDNSLELVTSFSGQHGGEQAAMVYQSLEFSPDTSGNKSYKFKVDLKNASALHGSTVLKLSIWDSSGTPVIGDSGSVSTVQFSSTELTSGSTLSSGTITPSTNQYNTGFIISIALINNVNYTVHPSAGIVNIDNVKLYEVDIATGNETEYLTGAVSQKFSGFVRDADDSGIFKLFNTAQDLSSGDINLIDFANPVDTVYTVQVESTGSGNVYAIEGEQKKSLTLKEGSTYVFDWSSSPSHPVRFSETSDGTHSGGTEYLTGVTKEDSIYKTTITVESGAPNLYYYCQFHSGMGSSITVEPTAILGHLELGTLTSTNLNGELIGNASTTTALASSQNFSIDGDITANPVSFDGSSNVVLSATIDDGVIDVDNFQDSAIVLSTEGLSSNDNDTSIPTAATVIDYVDTKVSSGGFDNVSDMNLKMGLNNSFVSVEEVTLIIPVDSTIQQNDSITLITDIEDSFKSISQVYVNGQKIRYAKDTDDQNTLYDYWFSDVSTINFKDGILNSNDNIEIRYYIQSTSSEIAGGSNESQSSAPSTDPTYSASTANGETSVNEGDSLTINTTTTNVADGTPLYWTVSNAGDFAVSSGSFVITSNSGSFSVTPTADKTTESVAETFTVSIRTVSTEGVVVASVSNITINDTSQTPTYSVSTANGETSVNEGVALNMSVSTTDVDDGTTLYWTVSNAGDFDVSSGSFVINSDSGSFSVTPTADNTTEATAETFAVSIRINAVDGNVVATSSDITINDTSQSVNYTLSATNTTIQEAYGSTTITLSAPDEDAGALVPYTISGVDTDDFRGDFLPTPIEDISRIDASTGIETNNWNLLKMFNGPAAVTSTSGSGWNWNNALDANVSSYGELVHSGSGAYPYPGLNIHIKSNSPLRYKVAKCFVISAPDGYPIGDFELWGNTHSQSKYHSWEHSDPNYTPESQGWILLKSGTSTSVNGQSDYFNLDNNDTLYTNYMFRFTNHTHAGQDTVRISGIALLDQERQSDFDFSNFSNNLRPRQQDFGSAVDCSADGNIFVVGERTHDGTNNNEGAVYTYQRSDVDGSIQRIAPVIKMPEYDSQAFAEFGTSVAISSDAQTLVVGAPKYDNDPNRTDSGVFFTYRWNSVNSEWDLLPSGDAHHTNRFGRPAYLQYDYFSSSLSLSSDGKKLVVGSEGHGAGGSYGENRGAVYTYEWDESSSWNLVNTIEFNTDHEPNSHTYSYYGSSVAMSHDGNLLVVGAREFNGSTNNSGRIYTYEWDYVTDSWNLLTTIDGPQNQSEFGEDVALSNIGDILCVCSRQDIYRYKWNSVNNQWDLFGDIIEFDDNSFSEIDFTNAPASGLSICLSEYGDFMYVGNENAEAYIGNVHRYILLEQLDLTGNFVIDENKESTLDILPKTGLTVENTKNLELTLDGTSESLIIDIEDSTVFYLNTSSVEVDEGQSILIKFSSDNIARGTTVPYVIEGDVSVDDFEPVLSSLTDEFIVGEIEDVSFIFKKDLLTEGPEAFTLRIPSTDQSIDVNILDTSITPTYTLEAVREINGVETVVTSIDEGSTFKFRLTHQHLPEGFKIPYEIKGVSADDFSPNLETFTGEFTIVDGTASYSTSNLNLKLDRLTENSETVTFEITDHLSQTQSTDITINDTSLTPTYSMDVRYSNTSILSTFYKVKVPRIYRYDSNGNQMSGPQGAITLDNQDAYDDIIGREVYTLTTYGLLVGTVDRAEDNGNYTYNLTISPDQSYIDSAEQDEHHYFKSFMQGGSVHKDIGIKSADGSYIEWRVELSNNNDYKFDTLADGFDPNDPSTGFKDIYSRATINEVDNDVEPNWHDHYTIATIQISTTNLEPGFQIPFSITGDNISLEDFTNIQLWNTDIPFTDYHYLDLTGTLSVPSDGSDFNIVVRINDDGQTEGIENFRFNITKHDNTTELVEIKITDDSLDSFVISILSNGSPVSSVNEGDEITFSVYGDGQPDNTSFNYELKGVSVDDFEPSLNSLTGTLTFQNEIASLGPLTIKNDVSFLEGNEVIIFETENTNGGKQSASVNIIDSSLESTSVSILNNGSSVPSGATVNEGDVIKFVLDTDVPNGTPIPYEIKGLSAEDFNPTLSSLTGQFIAGSSEEVEFTIKNDVSFLEGNEVLTFEFTSLSGEIGSVNLNVNDSSLQYVDFNILRNNSSISSGSTVNEGDNIKFVLDTNIPNHSINWNISGVSKTDFDPSLYYLNGSLTQGSNETLDLNLKEDLSFSEGSETLTFEYNDLDGVTQSKNLLITDSSYQTYALSTYIVSDAGTENEQESIGEYLRNYDEKGQTLRVKLVTTNVPDNTSIPYTIQGTVSGSDFDPYRYLNGTFNVINNEAYVDFRFDSPNEETFTLVLNSPLNEISTTAYVNRPVKSYQYFRIQQTKSWSTNWPKYMKIFEVEIIDDQDINVLRDSSYSFTTSVSSDGSGLWDASWGGRAGAYDGSTYYQWHNHYSIYPNDATFYQFNFTEIVNAAQFRFYLNPSFRDFEILGSNDGQSWEVVKSFVDFPRFTTPTASYPDGWITIQL